jgi:hypothetical protein
MEKQASNPMKKETNTELDQLKARAMALEPRLHSSDAKVAEKAMAELKQLGLDLEAWSNKRGVSLTKHTEPTPEGPETMRKCATWISTVINGKINGCYLMGKEGRKCLYSCAPVTVATT